MIVAHFLAEVVLNDGMGFWRRYGEIGGGHPVDEIPFGDPLVASMRQGCTTTLAARILWTLCSPALRRNKRGVAGCSETQGKSWQSPERNLPKGTPKPCGDA